MLGCLSDYGQRVEWNLGMDGHGWLSAKSLNFNECLTIRLLHKQLRSMDGRDGVLQLIKQLPGETRQQLPFLCISFQLW